MTTAITAIEMTNIIEKWDESEWLQAAARNPAFDFLNDPEEDIYSLADGDPFRNEV